jgi:DNA polymerase-3 subunit alpha
MTMAGNTPPFVHLHCHSHFSLLDGAGEIGGLVEKAKASGMNALALTDHGNLYGALEFYRKSKDAGVKPILGIEAYIAPGSRFRKSATDDEDSSYHLTLLAQNRTGFKNLVKLSSKAFLEGFYFKPRIDRELLEEYNEGIVCLSGCVSGEFSRALLKAAGQGTGQSSGAAQVEPNIAAAMEIAAWFHKVFGARYFIEVQNNGVRIQRMALEGAVEVARRMGIPLVATSDAHYVNKEDAEAQDILLCVNTGKFRTDANRMRMETNEFHLRTPDEMYAAFDGTFAGYEQALAQSQTIADSVDIDLELGKRHFPSFEVPGGKAPIDYLRELCLKGLRERYANIPERWATSPVGGDSCRRTEAEERGDSRRQESAPTVELSQEVLDRLERELGVIGKLGFPTYFLIVWDFVRFARERGIPSTARGSGVGSLVAYALHLSHVCPLKYDLLFERFLDESRLEAPDIDIDFCKDRRADVIDYVKHKYGEANVAQIGTFGTLQARAAIRDVGRALSMPISRVDQIIAMVPEELGITLDKALEKSDELRKTYDADGEIRELIDLARKIEGLARNVGTHAAAVVIADRPLEEYVPLQRITGKEDVITQWAMGDVEAAGLLKMDFLGLRNLTILSKAALLIEQTTGQRVDPHEFPLDDPQTFALLCRGETKGIFQLESGGIRDLLQRMKPDHFHDIIATNALYRPGPLEGGMVDDYIAVKHGLKQPEYKHPVMKDVLGETHGVMVYQEQVMRVLNRLGGILLADAYKCIKAISKKKLPIIAKYQGEFVAGAQTQGLKKAEAEEIFGLIEKFAGYGFNKSHSAAYAKIAYMTAYLKAHYPVEFMAALLSGDIPGRNYKTKDSLVEHIEDCRRMGIEVVPPDVNSSHADFAVAGGKICYGLTATKGCSAGAAAAIAASREKGGPFRDIFNFCERVDPAECSRSSIETLIKAGAFDSTGARRSQCMAVLERAYQHGTAAWQDKRSGQKNMFGGIDEEPDAKAPSSSAALPDVPEWPQNERLANEREVLGFYLSSHPLAEYQAKLSLYCSHTTTEAATLSHRTEVYVGGMIAAIKFSHTKNPRPGQPSKYAMFDLEDMAGILRTICWPEQFERFGSLVRSEAVLVVRGAIDKRPGSEEANLIVSELIPLDQLDTRYTQGVLIRLDERRHEPKMVDRLYEIVRAYPGNCELQLVLSLADGGRVPIKCDGLRVELHPEMRSRVEQLLGAGSLRPIAAPPKPQMALRNGNGHARNGR